MCVMGACRTEFCRVFYPSADVGGLQSCAMMGLQATSNKRKLEGAVGCMDFDTELGESPAKLGRLEGSWWAMDDSASYQGSSPSASPASSAPAPSASPPYYDSMDVVVPSAQQQQQQSCQQPQPQQPQQQQQPSATSPTCQLQQSSGSSQPSTTSIITSTSPSATTSPSSSPASHHHHQQQQQQQQQQQHYYQRPNGVSSAYQQQQQQQQQQQRWLHHQPHHQPHHHQPHHQQQQQQPQQQSGYEPPTIHREQNGKSYIELGSSYRASPSANERCCERSSWCRRGRACYRQRRLAVLNISMCKLARYRQFPDPSLHRSVLICNTLRYLEREMERDRSPPPTLEPLLPAPMTQLQPPEQGRLTPFPFGALGSSSASHDAADLDSGLGDSDDSRSINWGSVLSLSSQSPLDPLNNNELLDVDIGPELDLDFMPSWKPSSPLLLGNLGSSSSSSSAAAHHDDLSSTHESLMCAST